MEQLNKIINNGGKFYFVSTAFTFDKGLETMVFPADKKARWVNRGYFSREMIGVDFDNPLNEYTKHYKTEAKAREGHKETIKLLTNVREDSE